MKTSKIPKKNETYRYSDVLHPQLVLIFRASCRFSETFRKNHTISFSKNITVNNTNLIPGKFKTKKLLKIFFFRFSLSINKVFTIYSTILKLHSNVVYSKESANLRYQETSLSTRRNHSIIKWRNELSFSAMFSVTGNTS